MVATRILIYRLEIWRVHGLKCFWDNAFLQFLDDLQLSNWAGKNSVGTKIWFWECGSISGLGF